jgi:hypothetical protein
MSDLGQEKQCNMSRKYEKHRQRRKIRQAWRMKIREILAKIV